MGAFVNNPFVHSPRDFAEKFANVEHHGPEEMEVELRENNSAAVPVNEEAETHVERTSGGSGSVEDDRGFETAKEDEGIEKRIQQLAAIEKNLESLSTKLQRSRAAREKILARLFLFVLLSKLGKKFDFDKLSPSKYRTTYGKIVEDLMKVLCQLDEIQSFGSARVKKQRKSLVLRINKTMLPQADDVFAKATKLVNFTEIVLKNARVNSRIQSMPNAGGSAKAASQEPQQTNKAATSQTPKRAKEVRRKYSLDTEEPIVTTAEDSKSYIAKIVLPASERAQRVSFSLDSNSRMTLFGRNFQLPIEVDPRKTLLEESTYECKGPNTILLRIPKRKRKAYTRTNRLNDQFAYRYARPMIWGF